MGAQTRFGINIDRALGLLELYAEIMQPSLKTRRYRDDVVRASIVMAVAAMDAYFSDKYCELLVPFLKKKGANPRLETRLAEAGLDVKQALEMAVLRQPYRRVKSLMSNYMNYRTTQSVRSINGLYLDYGIKGLLSQVESELGRKTLVARVEHLVNRRHKIVHAGDLNKHNKANKLDFKDTTSRMKDMVTLVAGADTVIDQALNL